MGDLLKSIGSAVAPEQLSPQQIMQQQAPGPLVNGGIIAQPNAPPQIPGQGFQRWMPLLSAAGSALQTPSTQSAPLAPLGAGISGYVQGREYNQQLQQAQLQPYLDAYRARQTQLAEAQRMRDLATKATERGDADTARRLGTAADVYEAGDTKLTPYMVDKPPKPLTELERRDKEQRIATGQAREAKYRADTSAGGQTKTTKDERDTRAGDRRFVSAATNFQRAYERDPANAVSDGTGSDPTTWLNSPRGQFALKAAAAQAGLTPEEFMGRMGAQRMEAPATAPAPTPQPTPKTETWTEMFKRWTGSGGVGGKTSSGNAYVVVTPGPRPSPTPQPVTQESIFPPTPVQ